MSTGSDKLFTYMGTDYVLNQLLGYQDVNEIKNGVMRLEQAFQDQHAWDRTSTNTQWNAAHTNPATGPGYDMGSHAGHVGIATGPGQTTYWGDGSNLSGQFRGCASNANYIMYMPPCTDATVTTMAFMAGNYWSNGAPPDTNTDYNVQANWTKLNNTGTMVFNNTGPYASKTVYLIPATLRLSGTFTLNTIANLGFVEYVQYGGYNTTKRVTMLLYDGTTYYWPSTWLTNALVFTNTGTSANIYYSIPVKMTHTFSSIPDGDYSIVYAINTNCGVGGARAIYNVYVSGMTGYGIVAYDPINLISNTLNEIIDTTTYPYLRTLQYGYPQNLARFWTS